MREKCPCSELFWSVFSRIGTEYKEVLRISLYSVRMRENTDHVTKTVLIIFLIKVLIIASMYYTLVKRV